MNKYHAIRTTIDGISFASKAEARHYQRLKLLSKTKDHPLAVKWFCLQPKFVLSDGITYRPDFIVVYQDGRVEVQDVKGFSTREFKIKKRLMKTLLGIEVLVI